MFTKSRWLRRSATLGYDPQRVLQPQRGCVIPLELGGITPQALSAVYIHLVFSTKNRQPFLRDPGIRGEVHSYLGGISKSLDCQPLITGGVEDHIHLLSRLGRTISQSDWVKELKRNSNLWLKQRWPDIKDFQWQGGYADFSISAHDLDSVRQYITQQEEPNCAGC